MQVFIRRPGQIGKPELKPVKINAIAPEVIYRADDDSPVSLEVCTCAPGVHCMCTFGVHTKKSGNGGSFTDSNEINRNYLLMDLNVHYNDGAQERSVSSALSYRSCSFEKSAHINTKACKLLQMKFTGMRAVS